MTSTTEIKDEFRRQLNPFLSSKAMAITGKVLQGVVKGTLKVDLGGDGKDDGSVSLQIPKIDLPKSFKNADESILIFDDLERCQIEIGNILGYINYFVEHQGIKVVLLANEEQLLEKSSEEKEKKNEYEKIKEKLIGKTFEIGFDLHSALENFIEKVDNSEIKNIFKENAQLIEEIYQTADYRNLRILNQIVLAFERIFRELPDKAKDKPQLPQDILKILTAFSIEVNRANLITKDIGKLEEIYKVGFEIQLANRQKLEYEEKKKNLELEKRKLESETPSNLAIQTRIEEIRQELEVISIDEIEKEGKLKYFLSTQDNIKNQDSIMEIVHTYEKIGISLNTPVFELEFWELFFDKGIIEKRDFYR